MARSDPNSRSYVAEPPSFFSGNTKRVTKAGNVLHRRLYSNSRGLFGSSRPRWEGMFGATPSNSFILTPIKLKLGLLKRLTSTSNTEIFVGRLRNDGIFSFFTQLFLFLLTLMR